MKKLILVLSYFIVFCDFANAQNSTDKLRCVSSDHYFYLTPDNTKRVNKSCSVCYTDGYFSFYIPELGTRSFKVEQPTDRSVSKKGVVTEMLMNAEDGTMERGNISVQIEYGHPTKTFVISYTMSGNAYMIETNRFLGDAEIASNQFAAKAKTSINSYHNTDLSTRPIFSKDDTTHPKAISPSSNTSNVEPSKEITNNAASNNIQQSIQPKVNMDYDVKGIIQSKEEANRMLIKLDKGQEAFLNAKNYLTQDSCLVLDFNSGVPYITIPKQSDHVSCYGYYFINDENGYGELRVIQVRVLPKTILK